MTESYHFQIEPEPAKEALFRVGGVYRARNGTLNIVQAVHKDGHRFGKAPIEVYMVNEAGKLGAQNGWRTSDGIYPGDESDGRFSLIPGELTLRDGQWVTADAPATIGPFGSGASLKTDGSHITGRIEPEPQPASMTPTLDKLEATKEPQRPPLDWNKPTPFDTFKGFEVSRFDPDDWASPEHSHPLQRMTADSPTHGSAHLLAKP